MSRFNGTGVALVSPFMKEGTVDYEGLRKLLAHVSGHVDYLVVNGTTGESPTTTEEEKSAILKFVIDENKGKLPIVFGAGSNNTAEVLQRIKKTDFKGVDAILSVCPYYNKPSQEGIYQHYKAIAEASPVPVILYNVPGRTGTNILPQTTVRLSEIKNIIGIKEAHHDLDQAAFIARNARKDFLIISGDDLLTLEMIARGAVGVISVLANAFPEKFSEMVNAGLNKEDHKASVLLDRFSILNPFMYEEGNPVGIKQALEISGICRADVRLPLVKASEGLKNKIQQAMEANIKV